MKHLYPQIHIQNLITSINSNYNSAAYYYWNRKKQFYQMLENNRISALDFENEINEAVNEKWNKEIKNILTGIYFNKNLSVDQKIIEIEKQFDTSPYLPQMLLAIKQKNPQNFFKSLGFVFESVGINDIFNPVLNKISNFGNRHVQNVLSTFETGTKTSFSSIVSGQKNIRPDAIISFSDMELIDKDGVLIESKSQLPIELQGKLYVDWENVVPTSEEIMAQEELLEKFLDNGNFFGFSFKTWGKNTNGKEFMHSAAMAKELNNVFNTVDSEGRRHTWHYDYATEFVIYTLSKNIHVIVGPTNIAMFTSQGIIWMDNFLMSHIFYMKIQIQRKFKGNNFFPQIDDTGIFIRNYDANKEILGLSYRVNKRKKGKNFISMTLKF